MVKLLDLLEKYKKENPDLDRIMKRLNIDERTYLESLQQTYEDMPIRNRLLTNTTYIDN